jgi:cytochrome c
MIKRARTWILRASSVLLLFAVPAQASSLTDLAQIGDLAAVAGALDNGADVNEIDGVTALYIAVEAGNIELAKLLIDRGADVNLPVKFKRTPLYAAAFGGFPDLVKLLLDSGADPNQPAKSQTVLHVAANNGCLQCVIYLVEAGADVNALTRNLVPPIHFAVRNGHDDVVAYLRDHGAGPPALAPISARLASANVESGEEIFARTCAQCHLKAVGEFNEVRPNLWNIIGRPKGAEEGVTYTPVLKAAGGNWTFDDINSFIAHPMFTLPGTEMSFEGMPDEQQRADVIAYLRTLSDTPVPLPEN